MVKFFIIFNKSQTLQGYIKRHQNQFNPIQDSQSHQLLDPLQTVRQKLRAQSMMHCQVGNPALVEIHSHVTYRMLECIHLGEHQEMQPSPMWMIP